MTLDVGEHFIINDIVKFHVETALLRTGRCDILGVLTAAHQQVELLILLRFVEWIHAAVSAWEFKLIAPDLVESLRMEQFANAVTTAREQHREIAR